MAQTSTTCGTNGASCFLSILGVILVLAGTGSDSPLTAFFGWAALGLVALLYYNRRSTATRRKNEEELAALLARRKREASVEPAESNPAFQGQNRSVEQLVALLERQRASQNEPEQVREVRAEHVRLTQQLSPGWVEESVPVLTGLSGPEDADDDPLVLMQEAEPHKPDTPAGPALAVNPPARPAVAPGHAGAVAQPPVSRFAAPDRPESVAPAASQPAVLKPAGAVPNTASVPETKLRSAPTLPLAVTPSPSSTSPATTAEPPPAPGEGGFNYLPKLVNSRFSSAPASAESTPPPAAG